MKRLAGPAVALLLLAGGAWYQSRHATRPDPPAPAPAVPPPAPLPAPSPPPTAVPALVLRESAAAAGLVHTPVRATIHPSLAHVEPYLASMGHGGAVFDYDGDGWMDVFVNSIGHGAPNRLFRNKGDGTFAEVPGAAGLGGLNDRRGFLRALFFDADGDRDADLVATMNPCSAFLVNDAGTFREVPPERSGFRHCGLSFASNAGDLDGDGDLDLVVGDYFKPVDLSSPAAYDFMPNNGVTADNGGPVAVWLNDGSGRFAPAPGALGLRSPGWTLAVGLYDLRGAGVTDVWLATDFNADRLFFGDGRGAYADRSSLVEQRWGRNGMSVEVAELSAGRPSVFVSNVYEVPYDMGENILWTWTGSRFANEAPARGVARCGWSWGAKFADLDNDGSQDLVVVNGHISQNPNKDYRYALRLVGSGAREVMADVRNWLPMGDASLSGYQRKCVYRNVGGRFLDVTEATGWGSDRSDARAVLALDAANDGRLSLVEVNQNQPLKFYRNAGPARPWVGFALMGLPPNTGAWGARVEVLTDRGRQAHELRPANGFMSQSDPRLHFGLGEARLREVSVRWPDGRRQTLTGLAPGRYHRLVEPPR
jgi:hypothetical protein